MSDDVVIVSNTPPASSFTRNVATVTALGTTDVSNLTDGTQAYVNATQQSYFLDRQTSYTVDNQKVVAATPSGQWINDYFIQSNTLSWLQGGTLGFPTAFTQLSIQPTSMLKAPYEMYMEASQFNSTIDNRLFYGYNASKNFSGQGVFRFGIEQDYEITPNTHIFEAYWEAYTDDRTKSYRPVFANFTKNGTGQGSGSTLLICGFGNTDVVAFQDANSNTYASFGTGGSTIGIANNTLTITGLNLTFTGNGNSSNTATGYLQCMGTSHLYLDGNQHNFRTAAGITVAIFDSNVSGSWQFGSTMSFGGGSGVLGLANAPTTPTSNPTGGLVHYASGGNPFYRTSGGEIVGLPNGTATSATAGSNGAVPSQVAKYWTVSDGGTTFKIPLFNV